ncbi:sulfatase-like hydrolase/transferase [Planctomycetales bacterium ZRK34]|nr:sulfatase-like hydrolase/transferase [Planctomycetales bacterium ZRK34]
MLIDDMGYGDPSVYGNRKVDTPNMDRLAAQGLRLTNFYVNSPICSPSRVAFATGQYPQRWKIHSYLNSRAKNRRRGMADYLDPKAPTIARLLKQHGYATAHFGKWHMGGGRDVDDAPPPQAYGFDESLVSFEGLGDRVLEYNDGLSNASAKLGRGKIQWARKHEKTRIYVDRAIDFIHRHVDKPFYLEVWPNDVHDAHKPVPGEADKYTNVADNAYDAKFLAVLVEMDRQLGRLFDAIDKAGLAENTLIVLTSDNGPTDWPFYYKDGGTPPGSTGGLFGRKWSLYEGGVREPFVARWLGRVPAGKVDTQTIMAGIDLLPTFCHIAGVDLPDDVAPDGQNMTAALMGQPVKRAAPIVWEFGGRRAGIKPGNPDYISPKLSIREGDLKLLINPDGSDAVLIDLSADAHEQRNLAADRPAEVRRLYEQVRSWCDQMNIDTAEPVDLSAIPSPIIFRGDAHTAYRDPTVRYHEGVFHLFFTLVEVESDGQAYSYLATSRSTNLIDWSKPRKLTPRDQNLNYGSPGNIIRFGDQWVMCLQTYPRPNGEPYGNATSRVWTMRSDDLEQWSEPELLRVKGPEVPRGKMGRMIDPYLLRDRDDPGKWWCFYKQHGVSRSWSRDLKTWHYAGRVEGGENVCVIRDGDEYVMFHSPPNGIGIKRSRDLEHWQDQGVLTLGQKQWPWTQGRLTAGFVLDLRGDPRVGKALMFFHGSDYPEKDPRGGFDNFASLGIAWSDDLKHWSWPAKSDGQ